MPTHCCGNARTPTVPRSLTRDVNGASCTYGRGCRMATIRTSPSLMSASAYERLLHRRGRAFSTGYRSADVCRALSLRPYVLPAAAVDRLAPSFAPRTTTRSAFPVAERALDVWLSTNGCSMTTMPTSPTIPRRECTGALPPRERRLARSAAEEEDLSVPCEAVAGVRAPAIHEIDPPPHTKPIDVVSKAHANVRATRIRDVAIERRLWRAAPCEARSATALFMRKSAPRAGTCWRPRNAILASYDGP